MIDSFANRNSPLAIPRLYASASNGECPIQIDTPERFRGWTCTVVERDKASEGLLASGDERMEKLIEFRETLLFYQDPANGKRDLKRKNGSDGPGPLTIEARRELLARLLALQEEVGFKLISDDELFLIQQQWKSARRPDDGGGVVRIGAQGFAGRVGHAGDLRARVRVRADDGHAGGNRRSDDGAAVAAAGGASLSDAVRADVDSGFAGCGADHGSTVYLVRSAC